MNGQKLSKQAEPLQSQPHTTLINATVLILLTLLFNGTGFGETAVSVKDQRGVQVAPAARDTITITGKYWAFLIGIDEYQHVSKLQTAVNDVRKLRDVLLSRYGFSPEKIIMLTNQHATREAIEDTFFALTHEVGPEDSLFIYYAGHGQMDLQGRRGFWIPVDGKPRSPGTYISNARIRDEIAAMQAKHVYLVADSCFSGTLFAMRSVPPLTDKFYKRLYDTKSRWGLTSGMNEPVADGGIDGHSVFAYFFLKILQDNENRYLVPSHIYDEIAPKIGRNAEQQPRSEPIHGTGDEGGQFVFIASTDATQKGGEDFGISAESIPNTESQDSIREARVHPYKFPEYPDLSAEKRQRPERASFSATYKMTVTGVKRNDMAFEQSLYNGFYSFMNPSPMYLEETEYRLIFSFNGHFEEQVYSWKVYGPYGRNGKSRDGPELKGKASGTYRITGDTGELRYADHSVKFSIPSTTFSFPTEYIHIGGGPWQLVQ